MSQYDRILPNDFIAKKRLRNQHIIASWRNDPADLVAWLGAMQAQDYAAAKWALALRMAKNVTNEEIDRAVDEGRILRTHVLRPTWHFVKQSDIAWMLELTAPRVRQALAFAYRYYEIDEKLRTRATAIFERALEQRPLTRAELGGHLAQAGDEVKGIRLALLTISAEGDRVICNGPRRGKQFTYALLSQRAPYPTRLSRDESIAELARRYFRSHGPATIRDFVWWSGLTTADARRGLEIIRAERRLIDDQPFWTINEPARLSRSRRRVHLLPVYDEYTVAYRDRDAVPHLTGARTPFQHALIVDGQIAGTWKPVQQGDSTVVVVNATIRLTPSLRRDIARAADRLGSFLGRPVTLSIDVTNPRK
jgi:DNA glycosylase AlkZ-like